MAFTPLKRVLPQAIRQAGLDASVSAARVVDEAQAAIIRLWGDERAAFIHVISFKEGTLAMAVRSPSAAHTLRTTEAAWINEINRALGERKVLRVSVRREGF